MAESVASAIKNWIPYRLVEEKGETFCRWLYLHDKEISEPFFDETILKCVSLPENSMSAKCVSSLDILPEWASQVESVSPAVIIFHISRCGSTLLSQLLGVTPSHIVLSEVPFFDELIRSGLYKRTTDETVTLLKAAVELYGAKRNTNQRHMVIKTDSWHIHFYKLFRSIYPHVPFVFLYRSPDEVIHSQQRKRGMQSIPGLIEPKIFGFNKIEIQQLGLDEYMARVIESYLQAFKEILATDSNILPVNFKEGPLAIVKKVAEFSGLVLSEDELSDVRRRAVFHGKYPAQIFEESIITEKIPEYLQRAFDIYYEIEEIRHSFTASKK